MKDHRYGRRIAIPAGLFVALSLLVQARFLTPIDESALKLVAAFRPEAIAGAMNWIFRLGFAQVDAALALLWAVWLLASRRSLAAALPPLVIFLAIGLQAGLRLVIYQPPPPKTFELNRPFAPQQPVGYVLDKTDAIARETFVTATAPPGATTGERGSYPSGHSCRILFLTLLAAHSLRRQHPAPSTHHSSLITLPLAGLALVAALVGYSAMYYGYHWPSDVLGGYLLAVALYPLALWLGDRARGERPGLGPAPKGRDHVVVNPALQGRDRY